MADVELEQAIGKLTFRQGGGRWAAGAPAGARQLGPNAPESGHMSAQIYL